MTFLEIKVGKSINPNTGEQWWKADAKVSLGDNENPETAFQELKKRIDGWLPNPMPQFSDTFSSGIPKREIKKSQPDADIRLKYAKAVAANDKEQVDILESLYEFKIG
jgi:hypothetical protein